MLLNPLPVESTGSVYCASCTHTVQAIVVSFKKQSHTKPGQKCPRCGSRLDAAYVMRLPNAA